MCRKGLWNQAIPGLILAYSGLWLFFVVYTYLYGYAV
jgi:hypothetical protein